MGLENVTAIVPVVMRMGGGIVFVVRDDCVDVLRLVPGMKPDDAPELIGTANREHIALVAAGLTAAVS